MFASPRNQPCVSGTGTIGGLTMVSRVLGFVRDMIGARLLGASHANDAFNLAFLLPNIFRRLFAEGAFSSGFVPLFSRRLASGGQEEAEERQELLVADGSGYVAIASDGSQAPKRVNLAHLGEPLIGMAVDPTKSTFERQFALPNALAR